LHPAENKSTRKEKYPVPAKPKFIGQQDSVFRIVVALEKLDQSRAALNAAADLLTSEVNSAPESLRKDFGQFWRNGGCTRREYLDHLNGDRVREQVKRVGSLRLVVDHTGQRRRRGEYPTRTGA
jgi:hypothetical protein